jgi:hypothetical protein
MITFFDDRAVRVTSEAIRVGGRTYPLSGLTRIRYRRGTPRWGALVGRLGLVAGMVVPLVAALAGIGVAVRLDASLPTTLALAGGSLLAGLATGPLADLLLERLDRSYARGARDLQLWADYRGRPVLLLHTRDALRFGQISRALQRALEAPGRRPRVETGRPLRRRGR